MKIFYGIIIGVIILFWFQWSMFSKENFYTVGQELPNKISNFISVGNQFNPKNIPKKFWNNPIKIGIFNLSKSLGPSWEGTYPEMVNTRTIGEFIGPHYPINQYSYQTKINLKGESNNSFEQWYRSQVEEILNKVHQKTKKEILNPTVRINSNPWLFKTHFDCAPQYAVQLWGRRKVLLVPFTKTNVKMYKEFLSKVNGNTSSIDQLVTQIPNAKSFILNPGDAIRINPLVWHKVESVDATGMSVLLNVQFDNEGIPDKINEDCDKIFGQLWKKQDSFCKNKDCIY